ncbi:MAG TPA: SDR family oxidoreductase [Candidatus Saccharimonadales bacterium]|nr:SDR family oxidoreductase [Candidatus Saccharimonadales bacterium]
MELQNKKIAVIGASSGMGLATATRLHRKGAHVVAVGRNQQKLEETTRSIDNKNERLTLVTADMTTDEGRRAIIEASGSIDHLVVTAADLKYMSIEDFTVEAAEQVIRSKLLAPLFLTQAALPILAKEGSITFVSGIAAERPIPGGALTGAVNGGLNALVRGMAIELAPIRVNTVSPGWVETPIWQQVIPDEAKREETFAVMRAKIPTRRIGQPEDIAQAIESVITNGFMSGSTVYVDGGQRLV